MQTENKYKNEERDHYNAKILNSETKDSKQLVTDALGRVAINYFYGLIKRNLENKSEGIILDYGCGTGSRTIDLVSDNWELIGIDISEHSISRAKNKAEERNLNAQYMVMDAEQTSFESEAFDVIIDFGTFSSLDMTQAWCELHRILRPGGIIVGIETLGNNPLFNLKRKINSLFGLRTKWASNHILKFGDLEVVNERFQLKDVKYFSLFTTFMLPFGFILSEGLFSYYLKRVERFDRKILSKKFFQPLAFKTVFMLEKYNK